MKLNQTNLTKVCNVDNIKRYLIDNPTETFFDEGEYQIDSCVVAKFLRDAFKIKISVSAYTACVYENNMKTSSDYKLPKKVSKLIAKFDFLFLGQTTNAKDVLAFLEQTNP